MNSLSKRKDPIPTLYVKSFTNCHGPEHSIAAIFMHARNMAPCLLVFEDLDSLVIEKVRSYFLNQVDGLEANNGVLMLGSTNHLDRLDPAIAKRPSRFDRKYHFKLPAEAERTAYCKFWRKKLTKNKKVHFPAELCPAIAKLTEGFSFAYLKELFVTALLVIVGDEEVGDNSANSHKLTEAQKDPLDTCSLGRVMKKEAQSLQHEMNSINIAS